MLKGWDTARLDVSLHDVIHPVPACCFPRIQGLPEFMTVHMLVGAPPFLCKVRQDVGEKLAAVREGACRDVGWRVSEPRCRGWIWSWIRRLIFLAVVEHRLIPAGVRSEWARLRRKGLVKAFF